MSFASPCNSILCIIIDVANVFVFYKTHWLLLHKYKNKFRMVKLIDSQKLMFVIQLGNGLCEWPQSVNLGSYGIKALTGKPINLKQLSWVEK